MWASHFGRVEVVKLLIAAGADVHLLNVVSVRSIADVGAYFDTALTYAP
jgi:ankyrin repeat protein